MITGITRFCASKITVQKPYLRLVSVKQSTTDIDKIGNQKFRW